MEDITPAAAYGGSTGGIDILTKSLARRLAQNGITVDAIAPHAIETEMSTEWSEEERTEVVSAIPLGRMCGPEEVTEVALFLVSDGAAFTTGQVLNLNGALLMD